MHGAGAGPPGELPRRRAQQHPLAVAQAEAGHVLRRQHHLVPARTQQGIGGGEDHAVELLPATGGEAEAVLGYLFLGQGDDAEAGAAVGGGEAPALAQALAAPLELVALAAQVLDAVVIGNGAGDLGPDLAGGGEGDAVGQVRAHPLPQLHQHPPLVPRLGQPRPGDGRVVDDPPLGGGLGVAALHLVAGGGRQQEHRLGRLQQHHRVQDDVVVDAQGHPLDGLAHVAAVGEHVQQVAADAVEDVQGALVGGVYGLGHEAPRPVGHREAPQAGEVGGVGLVHRQAARELVGHRPHLGAALDARVAADGHEPGARSPHHPPRQGQVDDGLHVVHAVAVHGDAHGPDQHGAPSPGVEAGELGHLLAGRPRRPLQRLPGQGAQVGRHVLPARRVLADEALVHPAALQQVLQDAVEEADVASHLDLEEGVGDAGAQDGRVPGGRHPVGLQPGLAEGVDDGHPGAPLLGQVDVFHGDGLVVGHVAADEDQQVALQPVTVAAGGGPVADGLLQGDGAGGVADAGRVVHIVGAQEAGHLLGHVVGLVDRPAGGEVEGDAPGFGCLQLPGDEGQGLVPRHRPEAPLAPSSQQGQRQAPQRAQLPLRQPPQPLHIGQRRGVERRLGVEAQEVEADPAQVHAVHGPVAQARGAQGAAVADAVAQDAPGVAQAVPVLPGGVQDVEVGAEATTQEVRHRALSPGCGASAAARPHHPSTTARAACAFRRPWGGWPGRPPSPAAPAPPPRGPAGGRARRGCAGPG